MIRVQNFSKVPKLQNIILAKSGSGFFCWIGNHDKMQHLINEFVSFSAQRIGARVKVVTILNRPVFLS